MLGSSDRAVHIPEVIYCSQDCNISSLILSITPSLLHSDFCRLEVSDPYFLAMVFCLLSKWVHSTLWSLTPTSLASYQLERMFYPHDYISTTSLLHGKSLTKWMRTLSSTTSAPINNTYTRLVFWNQYGPTHLVTYILTLYFNKLDEKYNHTSHLSSLFFHFIILQVQSCHNSNINIGLAHTPLINFVVLIEVSESTITISSNDITIVHFLHMRPRSFTHLFRFHQSTDRQMLLHEHNKKIIKPAHLRKSHESDSINIYLTDFF